MAEAASKRPRAGDELWPAQVRARLMSEGECGLTLVGYSLEYLIKTVCEIFEIYGDDIVTYDRLFQTLVQECHGEVKGRSPGMTSKDIERHEQTNPPADADSINVNFESSFLKRFSEKIIDNNVGKKHLIQTLISYFEALDAAATDADEKQTLAEMIAWLRTAATSRTQEYGKHAITVKLRDYMGMNPARPATSPARTRPVGHPPSSPPVQQSLPTHPALLGIALPRDMTYEALVIRSAKVRFKDTRYMITRLASLALGALVLSQVRFAMKVADSSFDSLVSVDSLVPPVLDFFNEAYMTQYEAYMTQSVNLNVFVRSFLAEGPTYDQMVPRIYIAVGGALALAAAIRFHLQNRNLCPLEDHVIARINARHGNVQAIAYLHANHRLLTRDNDTLFGPE